MTVFLVTFYYRDGNILSNYVFTNSIDAYEWVKTEMEYRMKSAHFDEDFSVKEIGLSWSIKEVPFNIVTKEK